MPLDIEQAQTIPLRSPAIRLWRTIRIPSAEPSLDNLWSAEFPLQREDEEMLLKHKNIHVAHPEIEISDDYYLDIESRDFNFSYIIINRFQKRIGDKYVLCVQKNGDGKIYLSRIAGPNSSLLSLSKDVIKFSGKILDQEDV